MGDRHRNHRAPAERRNDIAYWHHSATIEFGDGREVHLGEPERVEECRVGGHDDHSQLSDPAKLGEPSPWVSPVVNREDS